MVWCPLLTSDLSAPAVDDLHHIGFIKSPAVSLRNYSKVGWGSSQGCCQRTVSVSGLAVARGAMPKIEGLSGRPLRSTTTRDEHRTDSERDDRGSLNDSR